MSEIIVDNFSEALKTEFDSFDLENVKAKVMDISLEFKGLKAYLMALHLNIAFANYMRIILDLFHLNPLSSDITMQLNVL